MNQSMDTETLASKAPVLLPSSPSILVVEDDYGLETVLRRSLSHLDQRARLSWVGTATEGLGKLENVLIGRETPYDLILADLFLPDLELGTRLWRFCQREELIQTPFAFMSSANPKNYFGIFRKNETPPPLLRKPFRSDELKSMMEFLIYGHSSDNLGS